jgi:hypothetical protein
VAKLFDFSLDVKTIKTKKNAAQRNPRRFIPINFYAQKSLSKTFDRLPVIELI